jgi:hypothetical protein
MQQRPLLQQTITDKTPKTPVSPATAHPEAPHHMLRTSRPQPANPIHNLTIQLRLHHTTSNEGIINNHP